jgi:L-alanine-DL-glutamate epimerase-like enolase superfamily enzyme
VDDARLAIELGACRTLSNPEISRVGGIPEERWHCAYCCGRPRCGSGGMLETGIGRATDLPIVGGLPGCDASGDISALPTAATMTDITDEVFTLNAERTARSILPRRPPGLRRDRQP